MQKGLSERTMKDICRCENPTCPDTPLSHFEECKRCKSTAYHTTVTQYIEQSEVKE